MKTQARFAQLYQLDSQNRRDFLEAVTSLTAGESPKLRLWRNLPQPISSSTMRS